MSKRKTILYFLVGFVALFAILTAGVYFYQKNSGPKPLTKEQIEAMQRQELMSYTVDPASQKSPAEQRKELELFKASKQQITEEEQRKVLTSDEIKP